MKEGRGSKRGTRGWALVSYLYHGGQSKGNQIHVPYLRGLAHYCLLLLEGERPKGYGEIRRAGWMDEGGNDWMIPGKLNELLHDLHFERVSVRIAELDGWMYRWMCYFLPFFTSLHKPNQWGPR